MQEEQENLIQSFPGFIDEIVDVTGAQDFHILVTTAEWGDFVIGRCADKCQTSGDPTCFWDDSIECNPSRWPCADSLGVGVDTDLNGVSCGLTIRATSRASAIAGTGARCASRSTRPASTMP